MHRKSVEIHSQRETDIGLLYRWHTMSCACHEKQVGKGYSGLTAMQCKSSIPDARAGKHCPQERERIPQKWQDKFHCALYFKAGLWDGVISRENKGCFYSTLLTP